MPQNTFGYTPKHLNQTWIFENRNSDIILLKAPPEEPESCYNDTEGAPNYESERIDDPNRKNLS